jgi:hypothetical protein
MSNNKITIFLISGNKTLIRSALVALFLFQSFSCIAVCDPLLDPYCDAAVSVAADACDPLLDPFCDDVNAPLDAKIWVMVSAALVMGGVKLNTFKN